MKIAKFVYLPIVLILVANLFKSSKLNKSI